MHCMAAPRPTRMSALRSYCAHLACLGIQRHGQTLRTAGADTACAECAGGQPASVPRSVGRTAAEESEGAARATAGSSLPKSLARLSGFFRNDSRPTSQEGSRPVATH